MQSHWDAATAPPLKRVDAAQSASTANHCNKASGQESTANDIKTHVASVTGAQDRKLGLWEKFKVFEPARTGNSLEAIADTRWVLTWEMVEGKRDVDAQLVA